MTGNKSVAGDERTASILKDGKVLISGEYSSSSVSNIAQLYDSSKAT